MIENEEYEMQYIITEDIHKNRTYKKIEKNVKLIMTVKDVENGIENYVRELSCGRNFFNNLVVIDLDSKDETVNILNKLEKDYECIKVTNWRECMEVIESIKNV